MALLKRFELALLVAAVSGVEIACPILSCSQNAKLTPGVCYSHDGNVPTKFITAVKCPETEYCPFNV